VVRDNTTIHHPTRHHTYTLRMTGVLDEPLRLGYACINTALREDDIFSSRGIILKNANAKGVAELQRLTLLNIADTRKILEWNESHGIRSFRLTSVLIPHFTQPALKFPFTMDFADEELRSIGDIVRKYGMRLTTHPDHFSYQISSTTPGVAQRSVADLVMHDEILTRMRLPESIMTVHGPAPLGDADAALKRWERAYHDLPEGVRRRLVIENDEWNFGVERLLALAERNGVPFVFDYFHNTCSKESVPVTHELIARIIATWRGVRPIMHYSEQMPGNRVGSHSQTVESLPKILLETPRVHRTAIDIDLEVKDKECSVLAMYKRYFDKTMIDKRLVWRLKPGY